MTFDPGFARLPSPPYVAVIFSSRRGAHDDVGYQATAARMLELARQQPGFLGEESTRGADGFGIGSGTPARRSCPFTRTCGVKIDGWPAARARARCRAVPSAVAKRSLQPRWSQ